MRVALFGATGRIGRLVLEQSLERGHEVRALVRDPTNLASGDQRSTVVEGEVTDRARVGATVAGADAVIDALGPATNSPDEVVLLEAATRNILDAMRAHGVRRLVCLSGAAVTVTGERKAPFDRLASALVRRITPHVVAAKQREYDLVSPTDLDWVVVRPPLVIDGPRTGRYRAGRIRIGPGSRISRADVADFIVRQLEDDTYLCQAPFVSY